MDPSFPQFFVICYTKTILDLLYNFRRKCSKNCTFIRGSREQIPSCQKLNKRMKRTNATPTKQIVQI